MEKVPVKYLLTNESDANNPQSSLEMTSSKIGHLVGLDDSRFIMQSPDDKGDIFAVETDSRLDPEIFNRVIGSDVNITLNETSNKIKVEAFEYGSCRAMIHMVVAVEQHVGKEPIQKEPDTKNTRSP